MAGDLQHEPTDIRGLPTTTRHGHYLVDELRAQLDPDQQHIPQAIALKPGDKLFWQNDPLNRIFQIIEGVFKESHMYESGYQAIPDFYYPGEIVGLDSLGDTGCENTAEAITPSLVYPIRCPWLYKEPFKFTTELADYFYELMGLEITASKNHLNLHRLSRTDQKLAFFLLENATWSERNDEAGIFLPMARQDIAKHLGMSAETLSRLFARFEVEGLIHASKKHVKIIDHEGLTALLRKGQ